MLTKANLDFLPRSLTPAQTALLTLWVLLMISFPIVEWTLGWEAMRNAVTLGTLAQLIAVILILWQAWGPAKTLGVSISVFILGWAAEALGSQTGFPFGTYSYTDALQPQILQVPIAVPLGWLMMLPPSWAVAQVLAQRIDSRWQTPAFITLSALAMTAWDFFLDPQMVAWGLWKWTEPGGYFGIPWSNYLGWLLVSALITAIIRPSNLPVAPLLLIYTITWLLEVGGLGIFWGMPGQALVGGVAMGVFAILGWRAYLKEA
jgi:uncharacterized membrane protein